MLNLGFVENYQEWKMILYPAAKINIGLYVTNKRTDGYHDICSLFFPLKLSDILEFIPDQGGMLNSDHLDISGFDIPGDRSENLIIKACNELRKTSDLPFFKIHLHKIIPLGAGLGGGSSDGAGILNGIQHFARPLPSFNTVREIALSLGSDCPFFLHPVSSLAYGRGENLKQMELNLKGYWISIFYPGIHVSTSEAYKKVKIAQPSLPLEHSLRMPVENWREIIHNTFEPLVFNLHPEIADIKKGLYNAGAVFASMSGSGSSVFGIFKEKKNWTGSLGKAHVWTEQV